MPLTRDELADFARDGLLIKRGTISQDFVEPAASLVQDWYRERMNPAEITAYTQKTFAPELGTHPTLLALFTRSGILDLVTSLLGQFQPVTTAQIQIRVPEADLPWAQPDKAMHVDGVASPHLDPAELRTFSLLVAVILSDVQDTYGGALRYVPGGHLRMAEWFRTEWALGMIEQVPPDIDAHEGTALLGRPGDVLLMHHLVPHAVGPNHSTTPRTMAYFRVSHVHHASRRLDALRDPWLDYPALTAARTQ